MDRLDQAPFPPMQWDDCDWWEGEITLAFGEAGLTITPYDPSVSRLPSSAQAAALEFQLHHGPQVFESVLLSLRTYYDEMRPRYEGYLGEDFARLMPVVESPREFAALIDLRQVHVHPWGRDGVAYIGLQFGCCWDAEHGFGVQVHKDHVVAIGGADESFAWAPEEAEEPA